LFTATAEAAEEAVLNALAAAETMTGVKGFTAKKLPMDKVQQILRDHKAI
jgi:D-aminopeptidase